MEMEILYVPIPEYHFYFMGFEIILLWGMFLTKIQGLYFSAKPCADFSFYIDRYSGVKNLFIIILTYI